MVSVMGCRIIDKAGVRTIIRIGSRKETKL
jgi:hypothetical protein